MFPDRCENCGLETDELHDIQREDGLHWFICTPCCGKLYMHEFYPSRRFPDLCRVCGNPFEYDKHC